MAVTVSGLYTTTWIDAVNGTTSFALNLTLDTYMIALFNNTLTPDFDADCAFGSAPFTSNQVSGTGWASGGRTLSICASGGGTVTPVVNKTITAGALTYDHTADLSVAGTTLTNARCAVIYADPVTGPPAKPAIVLINFGADYTTVSGTFGITWAAGGVFSLDLTP